MEWANKADVLTAILENLTLRRLSLGLLLGKLSRRTLIKKRFPASVRELFIKVSESVGIEKDGG